MALIAVSSVDSVRFTYATGGLVATASVNIMFGASTAYPLLLAFWGLNGLLQARHSCARAPTSHGFLVNIQLIETKF